LIVLGTALRFVILSEANDPRIWIGPPTKQISDPIQLLVLHRHHVGINSLLPGNFLENAINAPMPSEITAKPIAAFDK
jgi:hypothetical protein